MKRIRRSKHFVAMASAAGVLLVALVGWFGLVHPQKTKAAAVDNQIAEIEKQIAENRALAHSKSTDTAVRLADLFRLTKAMPDEPDMPGILLELNRIAGQSGIVFKSITPTAEVSVHGYRVVPADVILDGTYYELSDFLYRLRNLVEVHVGRLASQGRLFTVGKISIVEGEKHFPELEATMTINAFVYGSGPAGEDDAGSATTDTTSTSTDTTSTDTTSTTTTPAPTGAASEGASAAGIAR